MVDRTESKQKASSRRTEEKAGLVALMKISKDNRRYRKVLKIIRDMPGPSGDQAHRMKKIARAELEKG